MRLHYVWGKFRSDQELEEIAREMNLLGRKVHKSMDGIQDWVRDVERRRKAHPRNLAF